MNLMSRSYAILKNPPRSLAAQVPVRLFPRPVIASRMSDPPGTTRVPHLDLSMLSSHRQAFRCFSLLSSRPPSCAIASTIKTPGDDRRAGEWPWKKIRKRDGLDADRPASSGVISTTRSTGASG